jgi:hypothetical protein
MHMASTPLRPQRVQRITPARKFFLVQWFGQDDEGLLSQSHLTSRLSANSLQETMHIVDLAGLSQVAKLVFRGPSNSVLFDKSRNLL